MDTSKILSLAQDVFAIEIEGLKFVRSQIGQGFAEALDCMLQCSGRVVVCGIGKSGLVGRKIAATLASTGTPSFFVHPVEGAHGDMGMLRAGDVVLALSNSGQTDELNSILPTLRSLGAVIIAMTGQTDSTLGTLADIVIPVQVPREACPMGLVPTASTTAQLAMGDALALCLMRSKGFDKQDFQKVHPAGSLGQRLSLPVDEFMHTQNLPVVHETASIAQALEELDRGNFGLVILVDKNQHVSGVLTDGDIRRMLCQQKICMQEPASTVMSRGAKAAYSGDASAHVLDCMEKYQITVLPVLAEDKTLVGLVHLHDLLGKGRLRFGAR